jgi:hypothetical protein
VTPNLAKYILILFALLMIVYGLYISLGALRNWSNFNKAHKRIDLIAIFGDFGRVLYVVFGAAICIGATLCLFGLMQVGPLSHYFVFRQ